MYAGLTSLATLVFMAVIIVGRNMELPFFFLGLMPRFLLISLLPFAVGAVLPTRSIALRVVLGVVCGLTGTLLILISVSSRI
jgi:hypothetical protein